MVELAPTVYKVMMKMLAKMRLKRIWSWKEQLEREEKFQRSEIQGVIEARLKSLQQVLLDNKYYNKFLTDSKTFTNSKEFLENFPLLTKEIIRNEFSQGIVQQEASRYYRHDSTSGSTGVPLKFIKDVRTEDIKLATEIVFSEYTGWKFGQKQASLWAAHKESRLAEIWKRYIMRLKQFPPYVSNAKEAELILKQLRLWKPRLLVGYSSALYSFINHFDEPNILDGLHGVIASAESLYPYQRSVVENTFSVPVFMRYGGRELDNIAMECSHHDGYHILQSRYIVEILDDHFLSCSEEEFGRIVITDLMNKVLPFIRYDTGDEGCLTSAPCSCGRTSPRLLKIRGRSCDYIPLLSGKKIPVLKFNVLFEQMGDVINEFQIIHEGPSTLVLKIVPGSQFQNDRDLQEMVGILTDLLSGEMEVVIEVVDEIPRTRAGKFKYIIPLEAD